MKGYSLLAQSPKRRKSKRRTPPNPLTLEFADMIVRRLYEDIMKVIYKSDVRSMWLFRFPVLYGSIKSNFICHRSELEHYIEYARAWAIRTYIYSVSISFRKTVLFRRRINHFAQVKMRNIIYAMSNTHPDSLGIFKVKLGHTIIWRKSPYDTSRTSYDSAITLISKTNLMINMNTESIIPPTRRELYYDRDHKYMFLEDDNVLRSSFGITSELEY
jgi:hypothetical protein